MLKTTKHKWCAWSPFHRIKKNKSYKIVRFRQGFEKRFMASSREFSLFFFFLFLCSLVLTILSRCFQYYSVGRSMDSNKELFLTQNYFSQEVLEPNFSQYGLYCRWNRKWSRVWSTNSLLENLKEILSRKKNQGRTDSHGKLQKAVQWLLLGSFSNDDEAGKKNVTWK